MRHPLTGGGMTVALNDAVLLRQLLAPEIVPTLSDTRLVVEQMRRFHWKRRGYSTSLNILAQALYALFIADGMHCPFSVNGASLKIAVNRSSAANPSTGIYLLHPAWRKVCRRASGTYGGSDSQPLAALLQFLFRRVV